MAHSSIWNQKALCPTRDERALPAVPPYLAASHGDSLLQAQPEFGDAFCPDNGGDSVTDY
ncbi:MAG: hypothetical protein CUN49_14260 [Candidatus Thermofonsia Clade 1 bacterium]|uniref:Uncharacterized protein n=1 Tax=Candidatus Thermofonsia Clade 1 bacterium TaxID=2364210 RepID=A0A2M8PAY8_9CHLR|nr:MAG: hypothetical protein CUN49_14260 [Candidatus Thermofonsia Clade 1 bacterium]